MFTATVYAGRERKKVYEVFSVVRENVFGSYLQLCDEIDGYKTYPLLVEFAEGEAILAAHQNSYAKLRGVV